MFECIQNVSLRKFELDDIEHKITWINNPENNSFLHYDIPINYEKTKNWFINKNNQVRQDLVIEYYNQPVGLIGLISIDYQNAKAEYYISMGVHKFKRQGIATIASNILLNYAFLKMGLNKIYLNVDADNVPACKLYDKLGFKCEGIFKEDLFCKGKFIDRKRYAILKKSYCGELS